MYTCKGIEGSNPSLSAKVKTEQKMFSFYFGGKPKVWQIAEQDAGGYLLFLLLHQNKNTQQKVECFYFYFLSNDMLPKIMRPAATMLITEWGMTMLVGIPLVIMEMCVPTTIMIPIQNAICLIIDL
jgi:hypothetical protein